MANKLKDETLLAWFLSGGRVWKSHNKGWFARARGAVVFGDTHYGIDARSAAEAAVRARGKRGK